MYEEREYGIQVPPDEQAAFLEHYLKGGDPGTEEGLVDIRRIDAISDEAHSILLDVNEQRIPEKYLILRMCRAVREKIGQSDVLDDIEMKYAQ